MRLEFRLQICRRFSIWLLALAACLMADWTAHGTSDFGAIDNLHPRRDIHGLILDAHDGCLQYFDGKYYLYGTRYGNSDGWGKTNRYVVYESSDMKTWKFDGELLNGLPPRVYFRPYVIFNKRSHKYVLWFNVDSEFGVATSDRPIGPFKLITDHLSLSHKNGGDLGLFVDQDLSAYIVYSAGRGHMDVKAEPIPHHEIYLEKLSPDYLSSTGETSGPIAGNSEAPTLFRRQSLYYLLFDETCAFCKAGTGVRVNVSRSPMGPFVYWGNVNRKGENPREMESPWRKPGDGREDAIIKAQQTYVAVLPQGLLWMGDRWGSSPDLLKGHDFQSWIPLEFEKDGMIRQLHE